MDDEQLVWDYAREDFDLLGYERFNCGLPAGAGNCRWFTPERGTAA